MTAFILGLAAVATGIRGAYAYTDGSTRNVEIFVACLIFTCILAVAVVDQPPGV